MIKPFAYIKATPEVLEAFEILSGEKLLPLGTDNTSLLKHHRAVLKAAMDRALARQREVDFSQCLLESEEPMAAPVSPRDSQQRY
jgi:hypothetical protein